MMAKWYVKELSQLTQVSVQTLHHYDRICLLKPSLQLPNGYRLYSETDLLKLQQIIALKFFGFELAQIKKLLSGNVDMLEHFRAQANFLKEKARALITASDALTHLIDDCRTVKSIPWQRIIDLIEVYRMTQQIENTWVTKFLSPEELKEYAAFENELKTKFSEVEKEKFTQEWHSLVKEINLNLNNDPTNAISQDIGKRCMERVNKLYSSKYRDLRRAVWEKGFKSNNGMDKHGLSPEAVAWLDEAIGAYYKNRVRTILCRINKITDEEIQKLWDALLLDMFGENKNLRTDFINQVISDSRSTPEMKNWLSKFYAAG